jgi:hypothetical protein
MTGTNDHMLLALEEDEYWKNSDRKGSFSKVVGEALDRPQNTVERRRRLLTTVPDSQPIWDRILSGMPLGTGYKILLSALKRSSRDGSDLGSAVLSELSAFDAIPRYGSGRRIYVQARKPDPARGASDDARPDDGVQLEDWSHFKSAVDSLVEDRLSSCDESTRVQVRAEVREELKRTIKWVNGRIRSALKSHDPRSFTMRRSVPEEVIDWCKLLKVQVPAAGEPVNHEELKRTHRAWVKNYHPDRNAGNETEMNRRMSEVNAAYDGLIAYNFSLEKD